MDCEQFVTNLNPPPEPSCGFCIAYQRCRLPQRRDPNFNGRVQYSGRSIDPESIQHYENPTAYRRAPYNQSGTGDH